MSAELVELTRDGESVTVTVQSGYEAGQSRFPFSFRAGSEWAANLLVSHLRTMIWTRLRTIREESYAQGWKDAKAHNTKRKYFGERWTSPL